MHTLILLSGFIIGLAAGMAINRRVPRISTCDQALLDELNKRSEKIAARLEALDAQTP